ncbi:MAG: tRNA (N(6)-L-threonylcarbamoyladenosine(37)-C(2))-methylthiotransferase MtaB [Clostridium sp.]|nr:tRNA (N(6)-L-threonylcarbamoyladenosine(37)-C(2))-methylthiotransferase MtaB [Clostridium sp.]
MKKAAFHSLGCKVNSYESQKMIDQLRSHGFQMVSYDDWADVYVVNTCTVTAIADKKSRQMLHRAKAINPNAVVVAVGCYVSANEAKLRLDPLIDLTVSNEQKEDFAHLLTAYLKAKEDAETYVNSVPTIVGRDISVYNVPTIVDRHISENNVPAIADRDVSENAASTHTRSFLKIQDGCNRFCSYCIIPYVRGRATSKDRNLILKEAESFVQDGTKEIVLTGINISSYGHDNTVTNQTCDLIQLSQDISQQTGIPRIRLGSLEPGILTKGAVAHLRAIPNLCPHFHLSLQSGCDDTLKRMNRQATTRQYLESVERLREVFDHPAITADIIVGFPGETREEFEITYDFLEKMNLYELHVFIYSKREGTKAAIMPLQIDSQAAKERSRRLLDLTAAQSKAFRSYYIGQTLSVLWEEQRIVSGASYWVGYTPEYIKVALPIDLTIGEECMNNTITTVKIIGFLQDDLLLAQKV